MCELALQKAGKDDTYPGDQKTYQQAVEQEGTCVSPRCCEGGCDSLLFRKELKLVTDINNVHMLDFRYKTHNSL